jgi:solute carrier family 13 (sodium-dependent dicarboxylate transporter), member 2/3/5
MLPSQKAVRYTGLVLGPLAALAVTAALDGSSLAPPGRLTAGLAVWMGIWWLSEAIPLAATALLPLIVLPLAGAREIDAAARPYAHPLIFLFLGGFLLALGMERWGLHRRIALLTLRHVGTSPSRAVGGFMLVAAFMSMWTSNTATAIVMLPIAISVIDRVGGDEAEAADPNFGTCLLLGIAYACSIGGMGTIIGTAPNLFLVSFIREDMDTEIGFAQWMRLGVPVVLLLLPTTWLLLTRLLYPVSRRDLPGGTGAFQRALEALGATGRGEWMILAVFVLTALAWLTRPLLQGVELGGVRPLQGLTDAGIAITAALLLFVLPVRPREGVFLLDGGAITRVPWEILLLFGGGLSLAGAVGDTGVAEFLGEQVVGLGKVPPFLTVLAVTAMIVFLTELTSNTATTAALVPVLAGVAPALGMHPYVLIVPAALAASCAFMLPVATPPNAVVFGSGRLTIAQMARAGLWLNLLATLVLAAFTYLVGVPLLGTP